MLASFAVILLSAEIFTNAIEWLGHRLKFNEGTVGSILAAVGTAMPETLIPIIAILFAGQATEAAHEIGIGAILGAPFLLATLAMFVVGASVSYYTWRGRRTNEIVVNPLVLGRDIRFFAVFFMVAFGAAFIPTDLRLFKYLIAIGLTAFYIVYAIRQLADGGAITDAEGLSPLRFAPRTAEPGLAIILIQVAVALAMMIGGANVFIRAVDDITSSLGISALIFSLIIAPIATELPEKFNSILWVRNGKDTLALGNITGAMVFQSCIPVSIGMAFTNWHIDPASLGGYLSVPVAIISTAIVFGEMSLRGRLSARVLMTGGLWYALFTAYLIAALQQPAAH